MVNNVESCKMILESVQTLAEAASHILKICYKDTNEFITYTLQMRELIVALKVPLSKLEMQEPALTSHLLLENLEYSLTRVCQLYEKDCVKAAGKIEFELIPIIRELYIETYFFGLVYPDKDNIHQYYEKIMPGICTLPYAEQADKKEKYKYELSIAIPAYNHLEATKLCVNSLKQHIPKDLNYELILFNHGSNDGTKEYFESVFPTKQIDYKNNVKSLGVFAHVVEGKYVLVISNDVIITPRAIENLLICIKSDEKIGMAAPTSPNISNLQTIPASYSNLQELNAFALENNISSTFAWEQRTRLAPPAFIFRSNNLYAYSILGYGYIHQARGVAFGDDRTSMLLRRNGYKNVLCKDAYVHHIGSLTINEDKAMIEEKNEVYTRGRNGYKNMFGIDPWGTGFCYSETLIEGIVPENRGHTKILGLNCGMGENSLHIREYLKHTMHNTDVKLYNITDDENFVLDLQAFSDEFKLVKSIEDSIHVFGQVKFDYIVFEDNISLCSQPIKFIEGLYDRTQKGGKIAICIQNKITGLDLGDLEKLLSKEYNKGKKVYGDDGLGWFVIKKA